MDVEARAIRFETVAEEDGLVRVPGVLAGEKVEVIVLRVEEPKPQERQPLYGWLKGKIKILPGFDDPIPGMEEYM